MPCKQHQSSSSILKSALTNLGMRVPEIEDGWMCPTSMKESVLPVEWSCIDCRAYYLHRGIVLGQMSCIGHKLNTMTSAMEEQPKWSFNVPMQITKEEIFSR